MLRHPLKSLLLGRGQEEWDVVLPQILWAYRSTSHFSTLKTPNFLMLDWKTLVSEHLTYHFPEPKVPVHEYAGKLIETMERAHEVLREQQWQTKTDDSEEPPPIPNRGLGLDG